MNAELETLFFGKSVDWELLKKTVDMIVDAIQDIDKPKKIRIEIRTEDEFGEDLPNHAIFEMIDKEFEETKAINDLSECRMWKINELIIIVGVKI